jgi:hypothetical protein
VEIYPLINLEKMKKSIAILGFLVSTFGTANAQLFNNEDTRENFSFGAKIGANYSNVWDEKGQDFQADGKIGLAGGLFIGIPISKVIGIQPEVMISQKGFTGSGTLLFTPYSFTRTTTYLDIPVQIQIKPSPFLTLVAGPQFSYLLNTKNDYTWGANSTQQEQEFENENIRKNIIGAVAGFDINITNFVISGRASFDFLTNNGDGTNTTPRYKNELVQLTVGFKL